MSHEMPYWLFNVIYPFNRWLHLVAATLLVGGTLFFEFVVPLATADLKTEQQFAVFGRARWVFRRVVWVGALAIAVSGVLSIHRMWPIYHTDAKLTGARYLTSLPWVLTHVSLALIAIAISFRVTSSRRVLDRPIRWMQLNLILMLVAIFLASVGRHVRLRIREERLTSEQRHVMMDASPVRAGGEP